MTLRSGWMALLRGGLDPRSSAGLLAVRSEMINRLGDSGYRNLSFSDAGMSELNIAKMQAHQFLLNTQAGKELAAQCSASEGAFANLVSMMGQMATI